MPYSLVFKMRGRGASTNTMRTTVATATEALRDLEVHGRTNPGLYVLDDDDAIVPLEKLRRLAEKEQR